MQQTPSKFLRNNILVLIFIIACFTLSSCTNSSSSSKNDSNIVSGVASKGLLNGATITVYALDADGNKSEVIGTDTTDANGAYSIDVGSYTGNVLIEATGGTYTDEATNTTDTQNTETLRVAVSNVSGNIEVAITPITEIAVRKAEDTGGLTEVNIDTANSTVSSLLGGIDIITTMPADVLNTSSVTATDDEKDYGLMLATISEMVDNGTATGVGDAIQQISDDLSDNQLDDTGDDVSVAFNAFTGSENNKTGVLPGESEIETTIDYYTESTVASSIAGGWLAPGFDDVNTIGSLTFYPDGTYIHWETGDPDINCLLAGVEYGTYTYDAGTDTLTTTSIVDKNGDCSGWADEAGQTRTHSPVSIKGYSMIIDDGELIATRVVDVDNPIVGSWHIPDNDKRLALTFYPSEKFIIWDEINGVEYGTYSYDPDTETLTVTATVDEQGSVQEGMTYGSGNTRTISGSVEGDELTIVDGDTTHTFDRVK